MPYRTEVGTSTEPNPSATTAPTARGLETLSHTHSSSSSHSQGSYYYYLAAIVLLVTALAVASLNPRPSCTIIITGHSTVIQGDCPISPQLALAAHPKGLSFELYSKLQDSRPHGAQHCPHC
nr:triple gene block protein 3 [Plantago asiatica mosaic virus]